jgi:uncharacterized protein
MQIQEIENKLISILKKYGAQKIGIFGSYIRGEQRADSDLDILVNFSDAKSLLTLIRIERELSEQLVVKVDLLTEQSISPYLIDQIKTEMKVLLQ